LLQRGQIAVALVDRSQLELGLEPGEVKVGLLLELGQEAFGSLAVIVE
jgi:hypothetical protein